MGTVDDMLTTDAFAGVMLNGIIIFSLAHGRRWARIRAAAYYGAAMVFGPLIWSTPWGPRDDAGRGSVAGFDHRAAHGQTGPRVDDCDVRWPPARRWLRCSIVSVAGDGVEKAC